MTREEAKSCIGTIEMLQRLAYNIHGVMDVVDADNCKNIIEALEQQPCEDCISRQSIKRKLQEHHDFFIHAYGGFSNMSQNDKSRVDEINNCIAMVVNEPSVTPKEKTKWIPVSEGLPEKGKQVLCCNKQGSVFTSAITYKDARMIAFGQHCDVIAWMPLPEPYKVESEDKE